MKVKKQDIPREGLEVAFVNSSAKADNLGDSGIVASIMEAPAARLKLMPLAGDAVRVSGDFSAKLLLVCGRCLQANPFAVDGSLDVVFQIQLASQAAEEEIMLSSGDLEVYFYDGVDLNLGEMLNSEISLLLPLAPVCEEECLTICPHCGRMMTSQECDCKGPMPDSRWSKLAGLKFDS
jgi:uncharacterized protein